MGSVIGSALAGLLLATTAARADAVTCQQPDPEGIVLCRIAYATIARSALPLAVVLTPSCPASGPAALLAYRSGIRVHAAPRFAGPGCLIAAGPMLDGPDQVAPGRLTRRGHVLRITIDHTAWRRTGKELLRNLPWQPLIVAPMPTVPPGSYTVSAEWRSVTVIGSTTQVGEPVFRETRVVITGGG